VQCDAHAFHPDRREVGTGFGGAPEDLPPWVVASVVFVSVMPELARRVRRAG